MTRIRIESDSAEEAKAVADTLESLLAQHVVFSPVQPGRNPKYAGRQQFFTYATLTTPTDSIKK